MTTTTPATSAPPVPKPAVTPRRSIGPLLLRLHFYAGVVVAPFLVIAALTGLAYAFTPQLERVVHADELVVTPAGEPRATERLVGGREVRLETDAEERDRYGRLLAYVYAGDVLVNAALVREGYAQPLTVPPNVRFEDRFARLARDARRAGRGLWASCSS